MATNEARILIVEDNPQGAELMEAYLADTDYETRTANNGEEALGAIAEWQPDLVLLDVMMPKVSGFEVCRSIRNNHHTKDIGVIMITALDQQADIGRAVDVGTDDFLTKPINKAELLLRINGLLQAKKQPSEMERTLEYIRLVDR